VNLSFSYLCHFDVVLLIGATVIERHHVSSNSVKAKQDEVSICISIIKHNCCAVKTAPQGSYKCCGVPWRATELKSGAKGKEEREDEIHRKIKQA